MMRCMEHDREHCPEPRCHVLVVCVADIPTRLGFLLSPVAWLRRHGYPIGRFVSALTIADFAEHIATRLVAWMRAQWTERKPGPLRTLVEGDIPEGVWAEYGPGHFHPLDAVMSHADRVAALHLVATGCPDHGTALGVFVAGSEYNLLGPKDSRWVPWQAVKNKRVLRQQGQYHDCGCRVAIGINWATVAVLLDSMQELGIELGVVHEWRPRRTDGVLQRPIRELFNRVEVIGSHEWYRRSIARLLPGQEAAFKWDSADCSVTIFVDGLNDAALVYNWAAREAPVTDRVLVHCRALCRPVLVDYRIPQLDGFGAGEP